MKSTDKELFITHLFDAPPDVVFDAWTDPEKLKHWYAPVGCSITFKSIEVKKGGRFHYYIAHPVHGKSWVIGTYLEVTPPEKLIYTIQFSNERGDDADTSTQRGSEEWPGEFVITVTFEPAGRQTKATIHETVSEEKARKTGAYKGWIEMFDKLNQQLIHHSGQ